MSECSLTTKMVDGNETASIHSSLYGDTMPMVEVVKSEENGSIPSDKQFDNLDNLSSARDNYDEQAEDIAGNIMFRGITRETKAKFMRVTESKPSDLVWKLMETELKIKKPSLIISVSGGCREFKLSDSLKASFKATIQKASQIHDSCIISGGTYSGVMKLVSDAFKRGDGVCLGITAWDSIISKDVSIKNDRDSRYVVGSWLSDTGLYLDYKHTHFIMVKEENIGKGELTFRARLERYLIEKHKCPAVMIVVNGGWGTLETIHEVVKYGVCPIVVVQKSGRVADMMAYAMNHCHTILQKEKAGERHSELVHMVKGALFNNGGTIDDVEECYQKVIRCLKKKRMLRVAEMGSENDIDAAVIEALLSGDIADAQNETFVKLKLTLLWDRADYARENILSSNILIGDDHLDYLMIMALANGNDKYVQLLMDYGVNMYELLTKEILEFVYGFQSKEDNFPLKNIIGLRYRENDNLILTDKDREERQCLDGDVIKQFWRRYLCSLFFDNEVKVFNTIKGKDKFEDPFWELFLWAVVCNLPEMAKFLWPFGRDQMAKALIAAEVWKRIGILEDTHDNNAATLQDGSDSFRRLAQHLLDTCYTTKEDQTIELLTTTLRQVPNMTCIDIAGATKHYEFIAHNSVQTLLTDVWTGQIDKRRISRWDYLKVLFAIVFPVMILNDIDLKTKSNYYTKEIGQSMQWKTNMKWHKVKSFFDKLRSFYFDTPVVSFILDVVARFLFLALYTYMIVWAKIGVEKAWMELILVVWVLAHLVTEIYQVTQYDSTSMVKKCGYWFSDAYNKFDAANIVVFFIAWGMSFFHSTLGVSRTLHALNCGCWILRAMTVIRIHQTFGLYLEMVQEMLKELFWFLFILFTVIFSYAVTSTAILYPGVPDTMVLLRMFLRSWFHVYGEYFIELPPEEDLTHLLTPLRNSYDEYVVWVIFGFYLLLTNILLLNIIIAAFNTTYANIQEKSTVRSKYRRYELIVEYSKRASTPAPLSLIQHFGMFLYHSFKSCCKADDECVVNRKLRQELFTVNYSDMEELREFEYYCAKQLCSAESDESAITMHQEASHKDLNNRIANLESKLLVGLEKMEERIFDKLEAKLMHLTFPKSINQNLLDVIFKQLKDCIYEQSLTLLQEIMSRS